MRAGEYRPRLADAELRGRLDGVGAVVVEGPKACGKTETARQMAASEVLLDTDIRSREAVMLDPALILDGAVPRLIDEWQVAPEIWNQVRRAVDDRRDPAPTRLHLDRVDVVPPPMDGLDRRRRIDQLHDLGDNVVGPMGSGHFAVKSFACEGFVF